MGFGWHQGIFTQVFYCDSAGSKGRDIAKSDQTMDCIRNYNYILLLEGICEPFKTWVHPKTVNHSMEFVNKEGFHANKIEGHWRQMKAGLPTHGRKKEHYSSYLAEFK